MASALVLALTAANADSILSGERENDYRRFPPKKLPARAYLAVVGTASVVGECELDRSPTSGSRRSRARSATWSGEGGGPAVGAAGSVRRAPGEPHVGDEASIGLERPGRVVREVPR